MDYIFISPALSSMIVKAGHHQLDQYFISDHKGVYLQLLAHKLFDSAEMDRSHESYRRLCMGPRDIVEKYKERLE